MNKGDWLKLPTVSQKLLAGYVLILPQLQALLFLFVPISIFIAFTLKLSVLVTLLTYVPFFILFLQLVVQIVGLHEFTRNYGLKFPWFIPLQLMIAFYPYQILLSVSAFRAILRSLIGNIGWEKTLHINAHRKTQPLPTFPQFQPMGTIKL